MSNTVLFHTLVNPGLFYTVHIFAWCQKSLLNSTPQRVSTFSQAASASTEQLGLDHLSVYKFKQNVKGKERNIPLTTTHELPYPRGVELRGSHARIPSHGPRLIPRVGACSLRAARSRVGGRLATRERATARTAPALLPRCPNGTVHSPTHAPTQARERRPRKSASLASSRRRRWLRGSYS